MLSNVNFSSFTPTEQANFLSALAQALNALLGGNVVGAGDVSIVSAKSGSVIIDAAGTLPGAAALQAYCGAGSLSSTIAAKLVAGSADPSIYSAMVVTTTATGIACPAGYALGGSFLPSCPTGTLPTCTGKQSQWIKT